MGGGAQANQVFPLTRGRGAVRDPVRRTRTVPPRSACSGDPHLERYRSQLLIQWRSFAVDVELSFRSGDRGTLIAHGDQGGGYALSVDDGDELVFVHNGFGTMTELAAGRLADGAGHVRLDVTAPGGWTWDVAVSVDGDQRATATGLVMLGAMAPLCGIDVGIDRRSPVSWERWEQDGPHPFPGDLTAATWTPGASAPDAGDRFVDLLREIGLRYE